MKLRRCMITGCQITRHSPFSRRGQTAKGACFPPSHSLPGAQADSVVSDRGGGSPLSNCLAGSYRQNGTRMHHGPHTYDQGSSLRKYRLAHNIPRYWWVADYRRIQPRSTKARHAPQPGVGQTTENGTGLQTSHKAWWDAERLVNQWPPKGQVVSFRTCNYGNTPSFLYECLRHTVRFLKLPGAVLSLSLPHVRLIMFIFNQP